ncbi:hypothetical protein SOVF_197440, partial [Spinacia oleracea]
VVSDWLDANDDDILVPCGDAKLGNYDEVGNLGDESLGCTPSGKVVNCEGKGVVEEEVLATPVVGMTFSSWDRADEHFRKYRKQCGFGVVRAYGNYSRKAGEKRTLRSYVWKCECGGEPDLRFRTKGVKAKGAMITAPGVLDKRTSKSKKCGCPVHMYAVADTSGTWEVRKAVVEHLNHKPTPLKSRYISMYRRDNITSVVRRRLFNGVGGGSKISNIHRSLAKERNGVENMSISVKDLRNIVAKEKKLKMRGGDVKAMFDYFDKMTAGNQNFFHRYRLNSTNRLTDVMWVDASSRVAYQDFGDI